MRLMLLKRLQFLFVFLFKSMLASTLNSQTILWMKQVVKILNNTQNNATAVIVYVAKRVDSELPFSFLSFVWYTLA